MDASEFPIKRLFQTNKLADTHNPEAINNQQNDLFFTRTKCECTSIYKQLAKHKYIFRQPLIVSVFIRYVLFYWCNVTSYIYLSLTVICMHKQWFFGLPTYFVVYGNATIYACYASTNNNKNGNHRGNHVCQMIVEIYNYVSFRWVVPTQYHSQTQ